MSRKVANWILCYADAVDRMSESPKAFNVWSAIGVVGAVLKKKVWVHRGLYKVYPNMFIVLVSPPGIGKGSSIHPAYAFAKDPKPPLANFISDRVTAPRIIEKLAQGFPVSQMMNGNLALGTEASAVLMAAELPSFLGGSDWMTTFLCDAWDRGEYDYDTKNKGTHIVKDLCVSLIGACVPEFVRSINKDNSTAINGGFTARTVFVFANEKSKSIVWPEGFQDSVKGKQLYADLQHDLEAISKLHGEFTWTGMAKYEFEKFYKTCSPSDDDTEVVRHFKSRQNVHVLKVAMALSAGSRDDLVIDKYEVCTAIALTNQIRDTLDITFRGIGESPLAEATARIQTYIEKRGVVTRKELIRDNYRHITADDLDRVVYTLETIGFLSGYTQAGIQYYKHLLAQATTTAKVSTNGTGAKKP